MYDDTDIALNLLAKHGIHKAHFHWFKASDAMFEKLLDTPYFVSLTPDILHNPKTQKVAQRFPLERLLIETDTPWQHKGFEPANIVARLSAVEAKLAKLKGVPIAVVQTQLQKNIAIFYLR